MLIVPNHFQFEVGYMVYRLLNGGVIESSLGPENRPDKNIGPETEAEYSHGNVKK